MADKKPKTPFQTGYSKISFLLSTVMNVLLSVFLITATLPLFAVIALAIKVRDGGPVLYRGERLGISKTPFVMYKFRTLSQGAEAIVGAELLTQRIAQEKSILTAFGRFLRFTRLDELPQLFNVLKGDMDFLGPRPERPLIYEKFCKQIKGYDKRFLVKPGLIGYSQLFTPHSSPKRMRTLIDNKFIEKKQNVLWDLSLVLYTGLVILKRAFSHLVRQLYGRFILGRVLRRYREKRRLERVRPDDAAVCFVTAGTADPASASPSKLVDINEEAVLLHSDQELGSGELLLVMEAAFRSSLGGRRKRKKTAVSRGSVYKKIRLHDSTFAYAYVIRYVPVSPLNAYMVRQYFLHESII